MGDEQQKEAATTSFAVATKHLGDTPVATAPAIAVIALEMAMKYHDINVVKDGALYQQYKLEGRNMRDLHLDMVFETAMKIEVWLLGASERIASLVVEAIANGVEEEAPVASQGTGETG